MIVSQAVPIATDGLTQASSVKALVRSSDAESGMLTQLDVPLNASAPPLWPATQLVSLVTPVLPCVVLSCKVAPPPSSNA
jgi:hypothetical protein